MLNIHLHYFSVKRNTSQNNDGVSGDRGWGGGSGVTGILVDRRKPNDYKSCSISETYYMYLKGVVGVRICYRFSNG